MTTDTRTDLLTPALAARYAATFDRETAAHAPQGIHWCLCTPEAATTGLGADGHPAGGGGFLPESPLPRRMWASSAVSFHGPLPVGAAIERVSTVLDRTEKTGASGTLLFVTVGHETRADGALAVSEKQTIVYRAAAAPGAPPPPAPPPAPEEAWDWQREIVPGAPLLFRYSALTFNSHRIHYDLPYARDVEGYPGLVVHGPLMASLLLDLADRELGRDALASFDFRAVAPAFIDAPLTLLGRREGDAVALRVRSAAGYDHLTATARLR
ncbi:HTD2 family dehydratase [Sphingomonas immobilis]|uniref:MaoC family dehydratase N-terminal domain-containing protein n=1 Tax=Sphingomonas immobilis TaxID=3063997 RepID=A0ABT8ZY90_9SPHN|nr:MaoC family dehydratase N-terminal domain-containing protein [Sphingomonas sp. CA1-15]MDO7842089.1 MaoC family dehydratase N-terminal domain-containing protein [Sphingomonas sp. CA1-15]